MISSSCFAVSLSELTEWHCPTFDNIIIFIILMDYANKMHLFRFCNIETKQNDTVRLRLRMMCVVSEVPIP